MLSEIECATDSTGCFTPGLRGLLSGLASSKISSNVMEAMRLTLNEHHRKLRGVGDISDWLVSADVSGF